MKILVPVKRVLDYNVKIRLKSSGNGIETANAKMIMNPFDEIALEEAVRLKENNQIQEIIAVSIGPNECQEILRQALARGADRALLITTDQIFEPLNIAKILQKIVQQEQPRLTLLGKQAIDDDCNQTGQMLAALLDWPQGTFVSKLILQSDSVTVIREVDQGLETLTLALPAVITTDLRLNQPRYLSLPNIMRARQKPITVTPLEQLQLDLTSHTTLEKIELPPQRKAGIQLQSVQELLLKLKQENGVLL